MAQSRTRTKLTALTALACLLIGGISATGLEAKPKKKKKKGVPLTKLFDTRILAGGFDRSISFDYLPNGKILVAEKAGNIWIVDKGGNVRFLMSIAGHIINQRERGLEGVEVASDFATSRRVYLIYAFAADPLKPAGPQALRVTYIRLSPNDTVTNPAAPETVVLGKDANRPCPAIINKFDCPASISAVHQGGTVLSAPDGTLWVGFGDSNLPEAPGGQVFRTFDPASTAGKLLHIDTQGNGLRKHPFCKKKKNLTRTCTKVYARGFRNPFRFTLTPGGRPIVGDVGWTQREEINLVKKGRNYGWPCKEGKLRTPFYRDKGRCKKLYKIKKGKKKLSGPIYEYKNNRDGGAAVIMGPQHRSPAYPKGLNGAYFFGDYANLFIKEGVLRKGKLRGIRTVSTGVFPVQFRVAPNGNIAYVDFIKGTVNELVYAPNKSPLAVASASPRAFCNATKPVKFSAAGTTDPEGDAVSYHWTFGDGGAATGATAIHSYAGKGTYTATLRVSDGISVGTARVTVFAGNCPPWMNVLAPTYGSTVRMGETVALRGIGADTEAPGGLPNGAFRWDVVLVHKEHRHDVGIMAGRAAQFQTVTDHDSDSRYEVTPSVIDSHGYSTVLPTITLYPQTVRVRLRSNIGKVRLSYGGRTVRAPKKLRAAIGFKANLSAPLQVRRGDKLFRFKRWSQGGKRNQVFEIPAKKKKVVARYKRVR